MSNQRERGRPYTSPKAVPDKPVSSPLEFLSETGGNLDSRLASAIMWCWAVYLAVKCVPSDRVSGPPGSYHVQDPLHAAR